MFCYSVHVHVHVPPSMFALSTTATAAAPSKLLQSSDIQSSFSTEMTTDTGSYVYNSQDTTSSQSFNTPKSTHSHTDLYHPAVHPVGSGLPKQFLEKRLVTSEEGPQPSTGVSNGARASWTDPNVGNDGNQCEYRNVSLGMLMSAQCHGRGFHLPYGENSIEPDSQLGDGLSVGLEVSAEDNAEGEL